MALSTLFFILFIILSAIHIAGEFLEENPKVKIRVITKPFLLPLVVLYYFISSNESGTPIVWLIAIGLILGFVGDVVLLKPKVEILFMIGLGSFLIGHVLYIIAFFQATNRFAGIPSVIYLLIIVYVIVFILIYRFFKDYTKEMTIPVVVYMIIILVMSFASLLVGFSTDTAPVKSPWLLFIGALNFIASDFLLANQLFKKSFKYDQSIIMLTYLIAQLLIAQAYL